MVARIQSIYVPNLCIAQYEGTWYFTNDDVYATHSSYLLQCLAYRPKPAPERARRATNF